ncbi:response regulator transcription factor [Selenomonas sp. AB3002]|jgi:DNA-binding response OmpR family regulator|uniref:response regulator transcription factor n=1 Tax=Selenomonas sp. AB3002 TaxID=1392502 RepID=UPI00049548DB
MNNNNVHILIVEDELRIARFLQIEMEHEGFKVTTEENGAKAFELIKTENYDLILLDLMLPGMDGMTICQRVREFSQVPIIMLTARDDVEDKVNGLDIGADDYMTKPFAIQELFARVRNVLRKSQGNPSQNQRESYQVGELVLYPNTYEVEVGDVPVQLTRREYDLLEFLMRNKRTVLTRDQILEQVWGYDYSGDTNVVDVYIRYLRAKIDDRFGKKYIYTVRGVGYVIRD